MEQLSETSQFQHIRISREDRVLRIVLQRSPLNAINGEMHDELVRLFGALRSETSAGAVVLTGDGPAFSGGGDYAWLATLRGAERLHKLRRDAKQLIWDLLDIEIPIVAAVNGPAVGLGASIALLCDVIFMAQSASLADPHVRVGVVPGDGGTAIWPLAVGPALAKEFLMTGDALSAERAQALGLVNRVVPDADLERESFEFALRLAQGPPLAVQAAKICVNKLVKEAVNIAFDAATALEMMTFMSEDHEEALQAIREKRRPQFKGG